MHLRRTPHPAVEDPSPSPDASEQITDYGLEPWSPIRHAETVDFTRVARGEVIVRVGGRLLRVRAPAFRLPEGLRAGDRVSLLAFDDGTVVVAFVSEGPR